MLRDLNMVIVSYEIVDIEGCGLKVLPSFDM